MAKMELRKASFNLPRNRNCLETWNRRFLAHRFPQNRQSHSRRTEWPKRTTVRWQSRKTEAMEEGAVRETPTAFCSLDYPIQVRKSNQSYRKGRKRGKNLPLYGDQIPRRMQLQHMSSACLRMMTSQHPGGTPDRNFTTREGVVGRRFTNRKWFQRLSKNRLVSKAICLSVFYFCLYICIVICSCII